MWVLQRGHSGDGCDLASTLCKCDLRRGAGRFVCSELGKGATSEPEKFLFRPANVCTVFCYCLIIYYHYRFIVCFPIGFGLPPHNAPFPELLIKSVGAVFFNDQMPILTSTTCVECSVK